MIWQLDFAMSFGVELSLFFEQKFSFFTTAKNDGFWQKTCKRLPKLRIRTKVRVISVFKGKLSKTAPLRGVVQTTPL